MEEESLQVQEPWEGNQTADLWTMVMFVILCYICGDVACDIMRCQRAEDFSDVMPLRHPKTDPVGHAPEHGKRF